MGIKHKSLEIHEYTVKKHFILHPKSGGGWRIIFQKKTQGGMNEVGYRRGGKYFDYVTKDFGLANITKTLLRRGLIE
jgi:hypothetical protein